ncbi:MetQ/NlpA family ABC transporter substrate-binding protein [Rossellomorea oryzaecorticis]|jgi:D-methionine transport system substrate-binding protein|uniref:Lipoprotein n=1 Tax=Rossellomorea oryzaecorticis TaxID=1396505 RepID=A0ABW8VKX1_9BACI|nr:methionine ABC transporter substrate-binding protein [Bacillus sp. MKU004]QTC40065.1 MetQ/NlpA family ABC transporter substrate-binding protein [Bacillus sp. V3]QWC22182.1 MetQ/NlpA family ABC transporter substrate-binding protein [Bacillus haikouensis]
MKKWLAGAVAAASIFGLAACGNDSGAGSDEKELVVGASNVPHAEILEQVKPILEEKGIDLQIETYQDYILPNKDLDNGDIDANYFQTIPYMELQMKDNEGYDFVNAGGIHIEPIGVYSKKYKSLEDLPDGATILMSNSVSDHGRILSLLEKKGLITLKDGVENTKAQLEDIKDNPRNLKFDYEYEAGMLPQMYENEEGDAVVINSNYAIDAGLKPLEDSIAIEDTDSPYVNVITVNKGDEDKEEVKELVKALRSKEIQDFINEEWDGAVVPVSE